VSVTILPTLPRTWDSVRLKWLLDSLESGRREVSDTDAFEDGALSIGGEHIGWQGQWLLDNPRYVSREFFAAMSSGQIRKDDILLVKDGATIGKVAIATTLPADEAAVNEHVFLLRVSPENCAKYFFYFVQSSLAQDQIQLEVRGSAQPGLNSEFRNVLIAPKPPRDAQRAIADYLDRETARLDALVVAKERVLGLLAEKRRALITRAVTRGLDPLAPLRDSGIPWLGEIPVHWKLKRAKWLFWERDQRSTTGEEVLLSLRMEIGLVPHNDVSVKQTQPEELVGYKQVSTGEIVVNRMRAASGLVAIASRDGLVSPDYAVFRVSPSANAEYFTHLFKTELMQAVFRSESTGLGTGSSGFLRLYSESFLSLWFPCPPANEQAAILVYIDNELAKLGALRAATERTVTLLKERRAVLIATAVTGRIDVESGA